jgi:hypothetical protein
MDIDKMLGKMLNTSKGKSASIKKQNQWKSFTPQTRNILRNNYKDFDGDGVPNKWDCQPTNVMRQDSKPNKLMRQRLNMSLKGNKTNKNTFCNLIKKNPYLINQINSSNVGTIILDNNEQKESCGYIIPTKDGYKNNKFNEFNIHLNPNQLQSPTTLSHELKHTQQYKGSSPTDFKKEQSYIDHEQYSNYTNEKDAEMYAIRSSLKSRGIDDDKFVDDTFKYTIGQMSDETYDKLKNKQFIKLYNKEQKGIQQGMEMFNQHQGASLQKQEEWKDMTQEEHNYNRQIKPDTDGDRVPDEYDCQPNNIMRQDFSKKGITGIPMFDHPDDYLVKKEVVQMTPDEYMKKAYESHYPTYFRTRYPEKSMSFEDYKKQTVDKSNLEKVKNTLADPNIEMDIPYLEYKEGMLKEQEGRHRATAARELRYKTIPVAIVESNKDYLFDKEMQKILRYYEQNPRGKNQGNCHNAASDIANLFLKYRKSTPYSMKVYEIMTKGRDGKQSNHIVLNVHGIYYDPTGTQYTELYNIPHQSMLNELPSYYKVYNTRDANYLIKKGEN